jgi:hypothetical protein
MTTDERPTYSVRVEGGLILVDVHAPQSVQGVRILRQEIESLLADPKGPKDILVRLMGKGVPNLDAMAEAVTFLQEVPTHRVAVFGTQAPRVRAMRQVLRAAGHADRFKFFRLEENARAWLAETV